MPRTAEQREVALSQRRNQILQVSLREFVKKGYAGARMAEIAKAANISAGLTFRYFASKEELYTALLDYSLSLSVASIFSAVFEQGSPIKRIRGIVDSIFDSMRTDSVSAYNYALVIEASLFEDTVGEAKELIEQANFIKLSMPLFVEAQQAGELREGDPLEIATAFWGFVQGVALAHAASEGKSVLPSSDFAIDMIKKQVTSNK